MTDTLRRLAQKLYWCQQTTDRRQQTEIKSNQINDVEETEESRQQTADSRQLTSESRQKKADYVFQPTYYLCAYIDHFKFRRNLQSEISSLDGTCNLKFKFRRNLKSEISSLDGTCNLKFQVQTELVIWNFKFIQNF